MPAGGREVIFTSTSCPLVFFSTSEPALVTHTNQCSFTQTVCAIEIHQGPLNKCELIQLPFKNFSFFVPVDFKQDLDLAEVWPCYNSLHKGNN